MEIMADIRILLVCSDSAMTVWDVDSRTKKPNGVLDSKGVQSFACNTQGPPRNRICVCVSQGGRYRLRLYEWQMGKFEYQKDLDLPAVPKTIAYMGSSLFIGYSREYNICDDDTGTVTDLTAPIGKDTKPLLKYLPTNRMLVVTADLGLSFGAKGEPLPVPYVEFKHQPTGIAYCYPYIISVSETSTAIEVHTTRSTAKGAGYKDDIVQRITELPAGVIGM